MPVSQVWSELPLELPVPELPDEEPDPVPPEAPVPLPPLFGGGLLGWPAPPV